MKTARESRQAGIARFRQGRYGDAVAALTRALRDIREAKRRAPASAAVLFAAAILRGRPYPEVVVDPRLELLGVILSLAAARAPVEGFSAEPETDYAREAKARFGRFRGHPAVGALSRALGSGLTVIGAQRSMLSVCDPPELSPPEGALIRRPELLRAMSGFARKSDFARFFNVHAAFYDRCRRDVIRQMRGRDYAKMLEEYTGRRVTARYTLALCPLREAQSAGNLNRVGRDAAGYRITTAVCPSRVANGAPRFDYASLRWDIWHELGHTLLDDLLEGKGDGPWEHGVREHMAQGLAFRVLHWAQETGRTRATPVPRRGEGLPLLGAIQDRLRVYERDRRGYPDIDSFYRRLMAALTALPRRGYPRKNRDDGII